MHYSAFYIMGPSGSGKDSVIEGLCDYFADQVSRPPRYITRILSSDDAEQHNVIAPEIFKELQDKDCFSLSWQANGYRYAYDKQWLNDLDEQKIVLLNGSREYWPDAQEKFSDLLVPIALDLDSDIQRSRLEGRARETQSEIEQRIMRSESFQSQMLSHKILQLNANQPLSKVIEDGIQLIINIRKGEIC